MDLRETVLVYGMCRDWIGFVIREILVRIVESKVTSIMIV